MLKSGKENYYRVYPKLVLSGTRTQITVEGLYEHSRFQEGKAYQVFFDPVEHKTKGKGCGNSISTEVIASKGTLKITAFFECEQEYQLRIMDEGNLVETFYLYALEEDLFERFPYKGDLHMHTHYSDGMESPAYLTAACRQIGYDFMAITDHHQFYPSLEAQEKFADIKHDLKIYRGEEVHPPCSLEGRDGYLTVHMLNINGKFSVNELMDQDMAVYRAEIRKLMDKIEVPDEVDKFKYASCLWNFQKIREAGGMSVFCHPYWRILSGYHCDTALMEYLFETMPFDAYEMISGYDPCDVDSNTLQVSYYHEAQAKGNRIPIIGVSDSHGAEAERYFGWYYTIAFAKSPEFEDVSQSIRELYSVAAEKLPGGALRIYGPHRLVKIALFMAREVLPGHDSICAREGELMKAYARGESVADLLENSSGSVEQYYKKMWSERKE